MAKTKADFQAEYVARILDYPTIAQLYRAQDPRVVASLDAMAAMMAMQSAQVDTAEFEPFLKSRDGTVLADATLKGILPLARPAVVRLLVTNTGTASFTIPTGRRLADSKGRVYAVDSAVTIAPGATASMTAVQRASRVVNVTVAPSGPYCRIPVPTGQENAYLCELGVSSDGFNFDYRPEYFNVAVGDRVYQAETDELRTLSIVFGQAGVVGYQPATGEVFTLTIEECEGRIDDLTTGTAFAFEYASTTAEGQIKMALGDVVDQGQMPPTIETLRQIARYPALYDHNAVFLGNFDFLLRRYLSPVEFLSVWNEQIEERARGPSVDNINRLFFAGRVTGMSNAAFVARVTDLIRRADDSYRLRFVAVNDSPVLVNVTASVSVIHEPAEVEAQIRALVLAKYGRGAPAVAVGGRDPINKKELASLLTQNIAALKDSISDFSLTISTSGTQMPEDFRFVSESSLTVNVTQASYNTGLWNY
ncbi:hypothetical protein [Nevskia ramosa]|uniref:hypothetical protein n=1 Tax=Nevskia ramosa TaxID=64002 RepID=UPI003D11B466